MKVLSSKEIRRRLKLLDKRQAVVLARWRKKDGTVGVAISHIYVMPEYRGYGFGTSLIVGVLDRVASFGLDCCVDPVGDVGLSIAEKVTWYERHGFVRNDIENTWVRKAVQA